MGKQSGAPLTRRRLLLGATGGAIALAGCSDSGGSQDSGIRDTDGDGVIDSEDYAPRDPDVQSRDDLNSATQTAVQATATPSATTTPTATQTPTPTPTRTPTSTATQTPTPQPQASDNSLQATGLGLSAIMPVRYSATEITVQITSEAEIDAQRAKVVAEVYTYPTDELQAYGVGSVVSIPDGETRNYTVQLEEGSLPENERLAYHTYLLDADATYDSYQQSDISYLAPSDPFQMTTSNRIERDHPDTLPDDVSTGDFERTDIEGSFTLQWSGTTDGRSWNIGFVVHKYAYSRMRNEPRGRDYDEYVAVAQNTGFAEELAGYVNTELEASGFTDEYYKSAAVIDWVQSFPYVTDDVYEGYDEYPKFPVETLVDVGGDCEDTAILLASLFQSQPFNYDMVLIGPPGHMAAGIYSEDRQGRYYTYEGRDYYYIETTGSGWGIGDMPDEYVNESATIYQV